MKKYYNVIFPLWLILLLPPIVLLVLPSNFVIDSIVLLICFKVLKTKEQFKNYKNSILKIWAIGFTADIVGSALLLATQFFTSGFWYDNLTYPVAWNPFSNVYAFLYVLFSVFVSGFLIYLLNYLLSFNKTDLKAKEKRIVALVLALATAPYLFFFPTSYIYQEGYKNNLEKYQGTYVGDNSAVGNIIKDLYSGKHYETFSLETKEEPYGITINYKEDTYTKVYQNIEKDALILLKLVDNASFVKFNINAKSYTFDREYAQSVFDLKESSLDEIEKRYESDYFDKFSYLGHTDKYDLFDTSTTCGIDKNAIYTDNEFDYLIECSDVDALYLISNDSKIKLKTALEKDLIKVDNLFALDLKISKEKKEE